MLTIGRSPTKSAPFKRHFIAYMLIRKIKESDPSTLQKCVLGTWEHVGLQKAPHVLIHCGRLHLENDRRLSILPSSLCSSRDSACGRNRTSRPPYVGRFEKKSSSSESESPSSFGHQNRRCCCAVAGDGCRRGQGWSIWRRCISTAIFCVPAGSFIGVTKRASPGRLLVVLFAAQVQRTGTWCCVRMRARSLKRRDTSG